MKIVIRNIVMLVSLTGLSSMAFAIGDPDRGEGLTATCVACHGADGNSPAPSFPKIAGLGERYLLKQLLDIQSGAREIPEMTGLLDNASEQDLADMSAFYASQAMQLSGAQPLTVRLNTGQEVDALELGERLYRSGNPESNVPACSGCHSPSGLGNDPARYPRLGGQYAQYIEQQLRDFRSGDRDNDGDSMVMRQTALRLTDPEIIALANYIAGLHR